MHKVNFDAKYRPTRFEDVVGQQFVVTVLSKLAKKRSSVICSFSAQSGQARPLLHDYLGAR
jgi:hypothetical protein